jgi:hypothetical protein
LIINIFVGLIALQVGYCLAVLLRVGLERIRSASPQSRKPTISHSARKE